LERSRVRVCIEVSVVFVE
jgi:hypothetical protein